MATQQETNKYKKNMIVLKEIENKLPNELREKLMITVMNVEQEETAKELLKSDDLSPMVRKTLELDISKGNLRYEETIVDEDIKKQISDYFDREVKAAIKDGRLGHPDEDPFFNARMQKYDERIKKRT